MRTPATPSLRSQSVTAWTEAPHGQFLAKLECWLPSITFGSSSKAKPGLRDLRCPPFKSLSVYAASQCMLHGVLATVTFLFLFPPPSPQWQSSRAPALVFLEGPRVLFICFPLSNPSPSARFVLPSLLAKSPVRSCWDWLTSCLLQPMSQRRLGYPLRFFNFSSGQATKAIRQFSIHRPRVCTLHACCAMPALRFAARTECYRHQHARTLAVYSFASD